MRGIFEILKHEFLQGVIHKVLEGQYTFGITRTED